MVIITCIDNIFKNYDYNNLPIKRNILTYHNTEDNAWISIDKDVYSIRKDDKMLLEIFNNLYGTNVRDFILKNNIRNRIIILEILKNRKIGYITD